jgi:hypothetical protein
MDYNDGSNFGYDAINPYAALPIQFDEAALPSGRVILASKNEYPMLATTTPPAQLDPVADQKLVRTLETPTNWVEGFAGKKINQNDIHLLLLFIIIVIAVLQIKMMMTMDFILQTVVCRPPVQVAPTHVL